MSSTRAYLLLFLAAALVCLALRARSFVAPHRSGDEVVYLTLAGSMSWDASRYTTRDDPLVREFPFSTYRLPLFPHPPLYPLVLKLGGALGAPVLAGLIFSNLAVLLLLGYAWRTARLLELPPRVGWTAFAAIACGPLLLFSTARLHLDGLLGVFLACGLVALAEALDRGCPWRALLAGGLWALAFNTRYSALIALPLLAGAQAYHLLRAASARGGPLGPALRAAAAEPRQWREWGIVLALVLSVGLQHFYRVAATYGSIWPWDFIVADPDAAEFSPYMAAVLTRTRWRTALDLLAMFPLLLAFATPWAWRALRAGLRERSWGAAFALGALYLLGATLALSHRELRYFAAATPLLFLATPWLVAQAEGPARARLGRWGALTLGCMAATAVLNTVYAPETADIVPVARAALAPLLGE